MSSREGLDGLLQDPRIWRAAGRTAATCRTVPSGWKAIDRALDGGWPLGQLTELLIDRPGVGELALLLPALQRLFGTDSGAATKWLGFVAPPYLPYAPALAHAGVDLSRLLLVRPPEPVEAFWAMEQALYAGSCAAVFGWSELADARLLRRLQLAAAAADAWTLLFRPSRLRSGCSPAPLRISLLPESSGESLVVEILKRRGGRPVTVRVDRAR